MIQRVPCQLQALRQDGEFVLYRGVRQSLTGKCLSSVLALTPVTERPAAGSVRKLEHEFSLKNELEAAWAVRPLALTHDKGRTVLVFEDPGGEPLDRLLEEAMPLDGRLRIAIGIASALAQVHRRGLIHKDIKPSNVLVNAATGRVWLMGFSVASRRPRERQSPEPTELIAGTLAYMAPEQTGRMNRSVDARSDLYSFGITLYEMLAGGLPFTAADPMEWVHCHIARRPMPIAERRKEIPGAISAIVTKLLAKTAEDRYQTAAGVESDLRRCLAQWETERRADEFPLGEHDTPDRLLIPEKLYGREREIDTLLAAFDRSVNDGTPELVLVSGYAGIGKSAVVNELHKALVPPRGLFASGKFDQYKRDIPYATLAQAFQSLVRGLLARSNADLAPWRDAFHDALGLHGQLMIDLVPELQLIIGPQSAVPELSPIDAQRRFQRVFRDFVTVFAQREHPLALFLDDLQWLDAATLDLIRDLLTQADVRHLLLIGAYRDNEVDSSHPLVRTLDAIRSAGAAVHEIQLAPLGLEYVTQLIADALHSGIERAAPLARMVHEKTAGNPFFVIQFLQVLVEQDVITFAHDAAQWSWELERIHAKRYTDNVVDLMVGRLTRLRPDVQAALRQLACVGNAASVGTLSVVYGTGPREVHSVLEEAVRAELLEAGDDSYRFIHDRIHEAAYSLIPESARAEVHLRIGRLLVTHTPAEKRQEAIFEITNQLNRGAALMTARDERQQLAELNLIAARRAKAATAYRSALSYLATAGTLLPEAAWERCYPLMFAIEITRAECEFLTGNREAAEGRLATLSARAANPVDQAVAACLRAVLYTTWDRPDRAVEICLEYLQRVGIAWSPHPTDEQVRHEYERMWRQLGGRPIEALFDLPRMSDLNQLATMDVLMEVTPPAFFTDTNLWGLALLRIANLSIEHGNSDGSCYAYAVLNMVLGPRFGDYHAAYRLAQLGLDLVEKKGLDRFKPRVYLGLGNAATPWTRHLRASFPLIRRSLEAGLDTGDLTYAIYAHERLVTNRLASGDALEDVQREAESALQLVHTARFGMFVDISAARLGLIKTLRGLTPVFGSLSHDEFDERRFEQRLEDHPPPAMLACWYWIRRLQAHFYADDYTQAVAAAAKARPLLWATASFFEEAEYHFYGALARAAVCDSAPPDERRQHVEALTEHQKRLVLWAENCAENFEHRAALVGAEIARLEGRELDAERLYEQAIRSARDQGFGQNEAVAYAVAARFYMARGFEQFAHVYLRNARHCYLRWGADGKVRQLDQRYPDLRTEVPVPDPGRTIGEPIERLELATVLKVSQAVSGEIVLEKLVETLLRTAIEHAGAARGLLILQRGGELSIQAEATTNGDAVTIRLRDAAVSATDLPESVLRYAARTHDPVILDDAAVSSSFTSDEYVQQTRARSILCLPLIKQGALVALLYLENNLAPHVFTPARTSVLNVLASQAAMSLENSRLYRDLEEREAKIRRLVDSNIIGILISDLDGRIREANDAFLQIVGYSRDDLVSGRLRWLEITPAEWLDVSQRAVAELKATGTCEPFEKEYFRKDGSRVPVLVGAAAVQAERDESVAFVVDLTARKQVEAQLQEVAGRLITAQEEERRRVGRELHDHIIQRLGLLTISIDRLLISGPLPPALANALGDLRQQTSDTTTDVHDLSHRLHSTIIDHLGLVPAVKRLIAEWSGRHGIHIDFTHPPIASAVSPDVALCLFRVTEESLANIAKHSGATTARVTVTDDASGIGLSIEDDGLGFQPDTLETKAGLGFISMRERLRIVGGTIRVSSVPSRGTRVDARIPAMPRIWAPPATDHEYDRNR